MNTRTSFYSKVGFILLAISLTVIIWYTIDVFLLTFAGILIAILLRTIARWINIHNYLSDSIAITLTIALLIALTSVTVALITPVVSAQITQLSQEVPDAWSKIENDISEYFNIDTSSAIYQNFSISKYLPEGKNILIQATHLFSTTFGFFGSLLVLLFQGIFLAYDPETYIKGFLKIIPPYKRNKAREVLEEVNLTLFWWIVGKTISMATVGFFTWIGLWALGIPLSFTLGLLAAFLTFVPNIGPIIAAVPSVLIAVIKGPILAFYVILLYLGIQTVESYILTPIIQRSTIAQPPALLILVQLIMGILTGLLGLALASPLLAALTTIIESTYVEEDIFHTKPLVTLDTQ